MKAHHFLFLIGVLSAACQTAVSPPSTPPPTIVAPTATSIADTADTVVAEPLAVSITAVSAHEVTSRLPAYLSYTVTGDDISSLSLIARGGNGQLLTHQTIPLANGGDLIFWDGTASYVHDGLDNGAFVPTKRGDDGRFITPVAYQRAGEAQTLTAELTFDGENGRLLQASQFPTTGNRTPINLPIAAGDTVTFNWLREVDAPILTINPTGLLYLEERMLENGRYQLGLIAENSTGERAETFASISLNYAPVTSTNPIHIDPYHAIAFAYPSDWIEPTNGAIVQTGNISNTITAAINFTAPLPNGSNALSLKQETLLRFGGVHLLFEEEIVLGERRGLRTVYGYEDGAGQLHTGVLLTAVNDNIGIIIDIDGLQSDEAETITAAAILQESLQFLPTRIEKARGGS